MEVKKKQRMYETRCKILKKIRGNDRQTLEQSEKMLRISLEAEEKKKARQGESERE